MHVREATAADAPTVARMLRDFNAEYDEDHAPLDVLTERVRALLVGGQFWALFAADAGDGEPRGLATIALRPSTYYDFPAAYLEDLYVAPQHRSQGYGAALIRGIRERCRAAGITHLDVNVDEPDVDAMRFYRREGFRFELDDDGARGFYAELDIT